MNLDTIAQGQPWMTQDEHQSTQDLVQSIRELLEDTNTPEHPIIAMRLEDAATSLILVHRLEHKLVPKPGEDKIPAPTRTIGSIGKARERLRRATTELQRVLPAPTNEQRPMGLADIMKPIMKRAEGVLEEVMEEEKRREEAAAKKNRRWDDPQNHENTGAPDKLVCPDSQTYGDPQTRPSSQGATTKDTPPDPTPVQNSPDPKPESLDPISPSPRTRPRDPWHPPPRRRKAKIPPATGVNSS